MLAVCNWFVQKKNPPYEDLYSPDKICLNILIKIAVEIS